jgi:transposase
MGSHTFEMTINANFKVNPPFPAPLQGIQGCACSCEEGEDLSAMHSEISSPFQWGRIKRWTTRVGTSNLNLTTWEMFNGNIIGNSLLQGCQFRKLMNFWWPFKIITRKRAPHISKRFVFERISVATRSFNLTISPRLPNSTWILRSGQWFWW